MPGKVNPVIPEAVNQVVYQIVGNNVAVSMAAEAGQLQLNAMEPVIFFNDLHSLRLLTNAAKMLNEKCIVRIEVDKERCEALLRNSLVHAAHLVPALGHDTAAMVAKTAFANKRSLRATTVEMNLLSAEDFDRLLAPQAMA